MDISIHLFIMRVLLIFSLCGILKDKGGESVYKIEKLNIDSTFHIGKTLECGQCFHFHKLEENKYIVYGLSSICIVEQYENYIELFTDNLNYWKHYFSLDQNYQSIIEYLKSFAKKNNDVFMLNSINSGIGIRVLRQPYFETCCSYILSQQNRIPRIQKMVFELSQKFSSKIINIDGVNYSLFPSNKDLQMVSVEDYNKLGLGYRSEYLYDFVKNWDSVFDRIRFKYENDKELLKSCKGIGEKVANCICLYGLSELDAFPIDTWMKKIIQQEYVSKNKKLEIPKKYAGILQQFMFYYVRNEGGLN